MRYPSDTQRPNRHIVRPESSERAPDPRRPRGRSWIQSLVAWYRRLPRFVPWTVLGILVLIALSMIIDAAVYANKIHAGVTIAGHEVAGMTHEEAEASLTEYIEEAQDRSVTLVGDGYTWELSPDSIRLTVDVKATVSEALSTTRDSNFVVDLAHKLQLYFNGQDIPLSATYDEAELETVVSQVAEELDSPAVDASVTFHLGVVKEIPAEEGITVDRSLLGEQLVEALCKLESSELPVPVVIDKPELYLADNSEALAHTQTMVSGPLTLTSVDDSWTFSGAQVAHFVDFKTETVNDVPTLIPYLSAEKMGPTLERISRLMSPTPVDAHFEGDDEKAWVVPAVPGRVLKLPETVEALNEAALKTTERTAEAVVDLTEPEFTTEEAEAMGISDCLSARTTAFTGTTNRQNNVRVATAAIDNGGKNFLAPGEEFSFLKMVGDRTEEQGYKKAPGIQPNGSLDSELGGGICQVATTVFNSAFFAGLEITERRNHTIYISHYPEGRDAAVTTAGTDIVDLKFVNDTDHYIWIKGESDGITTTFWVYGTSDGREVTFRNSGKYNVGPAPPVWKTVNDSLAPGKTVVISEGQPYMSVKVTRWTTWPDGTVEEDVFLSKYPRRPKIIEVGPEPSTT